MEDDWDLYAVVRSCTGAISSTNSSDTIFSNFQQDYNFSSSGVQDLFETTTREGSIDEMNNLYKPFCPKAQQSSEPVVSPQFSPLSVLGGLQDLSYEQQPQKLQSFCVVNGSRGSHNPVSRSKRRKNQMKKVCHVPAESLSSDKWSWRKYGQKPIKGSPYPRGYYRCSTSKGCMARKQVERNRSDPGMFIVTYTAEHNHPMPTHRNSLAGSTRQKPAENPNKPSCSPEMSPAADLSPAPEKLESSRDDLLEPEDEEDDFSVSNMALDDDFFAGLEDLTGPAAGECFSDHFPTRLGLPWLVNSANTTTAGGS